MVYDKHIQSIWAIKNAANRRNRNFLMKERHLMFLAACCTRSREVEAPWRGSSRGRTWGASRCWARRRRGCRGPPSTGRRPPEVRLIVFSQSAWRPPRRPPTPQPPPTGRPLTCPCPPLPFFLLEPGKNLNEWMDIWAIEFLFFNKWIFAIANFLKWMNGCPSLQSFVKAWEKVPLLT